MTDDLPAWSYRRGDWYAVLGAGATVVLPPTHRRLAHALWELVEDGAGFDELVDALVSGGLRDLPGFVLLAESGGETRVLVRGSALVRLATGADVVELDGRAALTWRESVLPAVTEVRIEVGEPGATEDLAVVEGMVRISTADRPASRALAAVEDLPVAAAAAPTPALDHDGLTATGRMDPVELGPPPGIPGQPPAPERTVRPVARLVFSSGETVDVDRAVVIGRAPRASGSATAEEPFLVTVPSPHQEISATHLEVRPGSGADHGSAVATDLGSTNGTLLMQPGLPPEDLRPGIAVQLVPGAVIDLGEGVTIQVTQPAGP